VTKLVVRKDGYGIWRAHTRQDIINLSCQPTCTAHALASSHNYEDIRQWVARTVDRIERNEAMQRIFERVER
jgi:hypothetical protein